MSDRGKPIVHNADSRAPEPSLAPSYHQAIQSPRQSFGATATLNSRSEKNKRSESSKELTMKKSNGIQEGNSSGAIQSNAADSVASGGGAPSQEAIAREAYYLWEKDGRAHGRHQDHWHEAEKHLRRTPGNAAYPPLEKRDAMVKAAVGEKTDTRRIPGDDLKKSAGSLSPVRPKENSADFARSRN